MHPRAGHDGLELPPGQARGRRPGLTNLLRWSLTYGQRAQEVSKAAVEAGRPIPESCYPPEVSADLADYLRNPNGHFWRLSTARGIGFTTVGPIPWPALDRYAERYGFADDEVTYEDFMFLMQALDEEFLAYTREQAEKANKKAKKPPNGGRR